MLIKVSHLTLEILPCGKDKLRFYARRDRMSLFLLRHSFPFFFFGQRNICPRLNENIPDYSCKRKIGGSLPWLPCLPCLPAAETRKKTNFQKQVVELWYNWHYWHNWQSSELLIFFVEGVILLKKLHVWFGSWMVNFSVSQYLSP